ncbi:MAG: carboxymuconolactone decarboxylase family protein [Betaproteobacteria bacterium]|nr:carboxymuconolactone decarboxylase family protein [Betaproteobacteria bacterium]
MQRQLIMQTIHSQIPDYAKDLRLNLDSVLTEGGAPGLSVRQIAIVSLASAIAARHAPLTSAIAEKAAETLDVKALDGARTAAAIMGMNNVYYRFTHLASNPEYGTLPARLRMNAMANPGIDKIDFELASIAVSAINGCGMCIDSHEKTLKQHGVPTQAIQSAVRIASVIAAVAVVLEQKDAAQVAELQAAA